MDENNQQSEVLQENVQPQSEPAAKLEESAPSESAPATAPADSVPKRQSIVARILRIFKFGK